MPSAREHLRPAELAALVGTDTMVALVNLVGGRRIPSERRLAQWRRMQAIAHDWRYTGLTLRELAAKHGVAPCTVGRAVSRITRGEFHAALHPKG